MTSAHAAGNTASVVSAASAANTRHASHVAGKELLVVDGLGVEFRTRRGPVQVLSEVSFALKAGEVMGLVGESGSGKSMTSLALMRLIPNPPGRIRAGSIRLNGEELTQASEQRMRQVRGADMAMIFQEPMTALNPVHSIGAQIGEALKLHRGMSKQDARIRAIELLKEVGIPSPEKRVDDYPHHLSGGMRQRAMIAMALACEPALLIADEPTTALDVTVQAQIFDLLRDLQQRKGTAILLITHDMGVIAEMTDRVAVMYAGRIVEQGNTDEVLTDPCHPYTRGLIACLPEARVDEHSWLAEIPGTVPALHDLDGGCAFRQRCAFATSRCETQPALQAPEGRAAGRLLACHHPVALEANTSLSTAARVAGQETSHG